MSLSADEKQALPDDTNLFSSLVVELNIARRNFRSYPKEHPVIDASLKKVIHVYNTLLNNTNAINIAVARDILIINEKTLDKNNLVFRDFAKVLFEHGIATLILNSGVTINELRNFNVILGLKRDEIQKFGGISILWEKSGIKSMAMQPVRYDVFSVIDPAQEKQTKEGPAQNLWELFVQKITSGSTSYGIPDNNDLDPKQLALTLNSQMGAATEHGDIRTKYIDFTLDDPDLDKPFSVPPEKLATFINHLNPELRRHFISSSLDIGTSNSNSLAEQVIPKLSFQTIVETLDDIKSNRFSVSPAIRSLLQKMNVQAVEMHNETMAKLDSEAELKQKIRTIFKEHNTEEFVPDAYQKTLNRIMVTEHSARIEKDVIAALMKTLENHDLENQISNIILEMMKIENDPELAKPLINSLAETYFYLLNTGDYAQLIRLIKQCDTTIQNPGIRNVLRSHYTSRECLEEMLAGLTTWGKSKYDVITSLIRLIGIPFIEVLLDQLAIEENMSLRRFLTDRIKEFGAAAKDQLISRLTDTRWYVIRNLIILLRALKDNTIVEPVRNFSNHTNSKVKIEALRTLIQFQDTAAERYILKDMDSHDRETQLTAILLAEKSRSNDVFRKLISIISKSGFNNSEYEIKSAAIKILGKIRRIDAIPELAKVLASRSLLNTKTLNRLKIEIINSLRHYPISVSQPILIKLASGGGDIGQQANNVLTLISGKDHE